MDFYVLFVNAMFVNVINVYEKNKSSPLRPLLQDQRVKYSRIIYNDIHSLKYSDLL